MVFRPSCSREHRALRVAVVVVLGVIEAVAQHGSAEAIALLAGFGEAVFVVLVVTCPTVAVGDVSHELELPTASYS